MEAETVGVGGEWRGGVGWEGYHLGNSKGHPSTDVLAPFKGRGLGGFCLFIQI